MKGLLGEQFGMKYLGEATFILGLEVRRRNLETLPCQVRFTRDVLRVEDSRPVSTSLGPGPKPSMVDAPETVIELN